MTWAPAVVVCAGLLIVIVLVTRAIAAQLALLRDAVADVSIIAGVAARRADAALAAPAETTQTFVQLQDQIDGLAQTVAHLAHVINTHIETGDGA